MSSTKAIDSHFEKLVVKKTRLHARSRAAIALNMVWGGRSLDEALELVNAESHGDGAFCQELAYGSCRWNLLLEWYLDKLLQKPIKKQSELVKAVLVTGLYQLVYSNLPKHVTVDMSVRTVRELGLEKFSGLVNAVLRNFERNREQFSKELPRNVIHSYPKWIEKVISDRFDNSQQILEAGNAHPPMTIRLDSHRLSHDDLADQVEALGSKMIKTALNDEAYFIDPPIPTAKLKGIGKEFYIQDEAAQMAAMALMPDIEHRILDLCSAPGGKALHLNALLLGKGQITCVESSKWRAVSMQQRFAESGYTFDVIIGNAANNELLPGQSFDRILVDAPCSGLGVIRRHPDIKLLRREEDLSQFAQRQYKIVANAVRLLAEKGRLLYCTCTITRDENEAVIARLLDEFSELREVLLDERFGERKEYGYQRSTGSDNTDGFYYCLIEKE